MKFFYLLLVLYLTSCTSDKIVKLPEIKRASITEVHDVSAAYLFYDETQPDNIELNRKNLISTTNWLVNVDKRLKLGQAIPKIIFLQDKKRNASIHKNDAAKNYYSCNDTSIKNLGFIEFTNVYYHMDQKAEDFIKQSSFDYILIDIPKDVDLNFVDSLLLDLKKFNNNSEELNSQISHVLLNFDHSINFQQYILVKSRLQELDNSKIQIDNNEFIY